jgi:hypothetical protein
MVADVGQKLNLAMMEMNFLKDWGFASGVVVH